MTKLQITKMLVPSNKYNIKCPYSMKPSAITRHDTYNNASAMSEISYMIGNNREVSFHYAVDDYRAVQGISTNRNAWACGDGSKSNGGNRTSISVEVCYSKSGGEKYTKASDNALTLIATLMKQYGIPSTRVFYHRHWSGKNCPHRTIDMGISEIQYQQMVQVRYNEIYGGGNVVNHESKPTPGNSYKVGDIVKINGVYSSSESNKKLHPTKTKGKITKIVKGARNPYLLENGNIGWTNNECIVNASTHSNSTSKPSKSFLIKVNGVKKGDMLNIREKPSPSSKITGKLKYNDPNKYTIIATEKHGSETWGKLKSGLGWINLRYTKRV